MIVDEESLRNKIYVIRNQQVMLDFDLAEIYGYQTSKLNEQVRNNAERFEGEDFMFQLTKEEFENLMSNNRISKMPSILKGTFKPRAILLYARRKKSNRLPDRSSERKGILSPRDTTDNKKVPSALQLPLPPHS